MIDVGNVTGFVVQGLALDQQYFFAATAYTNFADWYAYCIDAEWWVTEYPDFTERDAQCTNWWPNNHESDYSNEVSYIEHSPTLPPAPATGGSIAYTWIEPPQPGEGGQIEIQILPDGSPLIILPDIGSGDAVEFK